jgi:serine/threonine protein phosphatase PrpC
MSEQGHANAARLGGQGTNPPKISQRDAKRILYACRDQATDRLSEILAEFIKAVEKAIFGLAEQTNDQETQSGFFVFMDQIRDNQAAVQERFKTSFEGKINAAMGQPAKPAKAPSMLDDDEDELNLSLMDEGALESSVAVSNIASQLATVCEEQLFALDKRMAVLLDKEAIETEDNPLGPATIVESMWEAQSEIEAPTTVKLEVFKILHKDLERELPGVYQDLNTMLVENRVLPKVRVGVKKRGSSDDRTETTITQTREDTTLPGGAAQTPFSSMSPQETLAAIQRLLAIPAGAVVRKSASDPDIAPVMSALNAFQLGEPKGIHEAGLDDVPQPSAETNILHNLKSSDLAKSMRDAELLTLEAVARLFDAILEDGNIPPAAKAQIARLQIPVLKVAILDQAIFSQSSHPVRRLLDKLAEAGMGWSEAQGYDDPLYKKIESIVKRVLDEFSDDPETFAIILDDLEEFLDAQSREAEGEAADSAEVIAARERYAQASTVAQYQVDKRLKDDGIPEGIRSFLKTHWGHLLVLICLDENEGEGGEQWNSALETMDKLLWSVQPKQTQEERQELVQALPGLIKVLEGGMDAAGMLSGERRHVRKQLAAIHTATIRTDQSKPPRPIKEKKTTAEEEADHYAEIIRNAVATANGAIHKAAQVQSEYSSMGTTMVCAMFHSQRITLAHVGDSRAYRVRDGRIEQMTVDHTAIQRLIARGFYTPEEAKLHAKKKYLNHVTRALGVEAEVQADIQHFDVEPGDLYVLCSDGLSDMVDDATIGATVVEHVADLTTAAQTLIDFANQAGGKDNISVVIARPKGSFVADKTLTDLNKDSLFEMVALTDVGRKRSHNEDCVEVSPKLGVGVLADGMGGYNAGEIASSLAVKRFMIEFRKQMFPGEVIEGEEAESAEAVEQEVIHELEKVEASAERRQDLVALVQNLQVGTWVEFHLSNDTIKRAKLAWVSPDTGTYLFTDAHGEKVVETTQRGLTAMLYRRVVRLLDHDPMFDRAVGSMMQHLESQAASG